MTSAPAVENATFAVDHANQTTSFDVTSNSQAADDEQHMFCKASPCGAVMSWHLPVNSGSAAETSPCGAVMSWHLPVNSESAAESFV